MEWTEVETSSRFRVLVASGELHAYQVFADSTDTVRLTRWLPRPNVAPSELVREASRNTIVFPMGRGPGRPGGAPEVDALVASAKLYAERFEAGQDIDGYPHWQRRPRTTARFLATGDANDCPNC